MKDKNIYEEGMNAEEFLSANPNINARDDSSLRRAILEQYFPETFKVLSDLRGFGVRRIYATKNEKELLALCECHVNKADFRYYNKYLQDKGIKDFFDKVRRIKEDSTLDMHAYRLEKSSQRNENNPFDLDVALAIFKRV